MVRQLRAAVVDNRSHFQEAEGTGTRVPGKAKGFEVVGKGASAEGAVRVAPEKSPDIVLLDITRPGGTSEAARSLADGCPTVRTITLSVSESDRFLARALSAAAKAYLPNGVSGADLISAILAVSKGASYVMLGLPARLLMEAIAQQPRPVEDRPILTVREGQILAEVSRGLTNKEIARKLMLSEKTIKNAMTQIMQKLGVHNRVQAALAVQNRGRSTP
jgi:DNA-binding NarL/FixJ family response regulator